MWLSAALAGPEDPWTTAEDVVLRRDRADVVLGAPRDPRLTAALLEGDDALSRRLRDFYPEEHKAQWLLRTRLRLDAGEFPRPQASGDVPDPGVSPRVGVDGRVYDGPLEGRLALSAGLDIPGLDGVLRVEALRVGLRSRGAWLAISQEPRWFGPGRHGALLYSDHGDPLPGIDAGATFRLPKKATVAGRFSTRLLVGCLPGERADVVRPGWLMLDLRWQPVPWIELGLSRNSIFGGVGRPIDLGQILLPTKPHVEDDPDLLLPDTDERASVDIRISAPLKRWGIPGIDTFEAYLQQGGEDVIGRHAGPVPVPSLAGVANLYGLGVYGGPWLIQGELAVIEDDVFRWYVGHRVYHDGWTKDGLSLGHPTGGDSRTASLRAGFVDADRVATLSYQATSRVQVLDRVADTVFIATEQERRHTVTAAYTRLQPLGASVGGSLSVGRVTGRGFEARADGWEVGAQFSLDIGRHGRPGPGGVQEAP